MFNDDFDYWTYKLILLVKLLFLYILVNFRLISGNNINVYKYCSI